MWNFSGYSYRVYYDGTIETFKGQHIPYAVLGMLVVLFCNVIPTILILLHSFHKTHTILNHLPLSVQTTLFPFMDNILACYEDGTNGTRNCCYFGVVYPLVFIRMSVHTVVQPLQKIHRRCITSSIKYILGCMVEYVTHRSIQLNSFTLCSFFSHG